MLLCQNAQTFNLEGSLVSDASSTRSPVFDIFNSFNLQVFLFWKLTLFLSLTIYLFIYLFFLDLRGLHCAPVRLHQRETEDREGG